MAQLKDTVVAGSLRVTDTTYSTNINLSSATASQAVVTDTSKNLISKGITDNTSATALETSDTNLVTARSVANAGYVKSSGVTSITIQTTSPITGGSATATTATGSYTIAHDSSDGNKHVPATGTENNGKFLKAGSTAGSLSWANAVTSITIKTTSPLSGGSDTATTTTGTYTLSLGTVGVGNGGTGATTLTSGEVLIGNGDSAVSTRAILNNTSVGTLGWNTAGATNANNLRLINVNTIAYWDGRFRSDTNASNLSYCNQGAFGTMAIKTVGNGFNDSSGTLSVAYGTAANTAVQGNATLVTLNGTDKTAASVASFYAPTGAGTSGYVLKSSGSGAPDWGIEYHVEIISLIS